MIKYGKPYKEALSDNHETGPGKHLNLQFGEWLHGLPLNWTAADQNVEAQRADAEPPLNGISTPAA